MTDQTPWPSPPNGPGDKAERSSRLGELLQRRPIAFAFAFEGGLAIVAIVLALVFGLRPWLTIQLDMDALGHSVVATAPLVVAMLTLMQIRWQWVRRLERIVREHLLPLFSDAGPMAVAGIALMAGIGEELLFRGVIQAGLSGLLGPIAALAIASLLFGLAHALTVAYFVLTCLMGLYLGWLYLATGNLLVPIAVHFLYDWIVLSWYLYRERRQA
ncbi:MAG: CPBP family glutamic-type intramembrane protease [Wenzhouxiangellaceae bacterium]